VGERYQAEALGYAYEGYAGGLNQFAKANFVRQAERFSAAASSI
jgi:hypothetical protein